MKERRKNVRKLPLRKDMPEELAALAIAGDEDEEPTIVLSSSEHAATAWRDLRLGAIPAFVGWGVDTSIRWVRGHGVATAIVATAATSTVVYGGVNTMLDGDRRPLAQPPAITLVVTAPATPQKAQPTLAPPPSPTSTIPAVRNPHPNVSPSSDHQPEPTRPLRTTPPTTDAPESPSATPADTASPTAAITSEDKPTPAVTTSPPTPTQPPDTTTPPPTLAPEPTVTTAQRDCVLRVDVDPLLDLCLLG